METIQKTIQVPENHQITVDIPLPADLPVGDMADIVVTVAVSRRDRAPESLLGLAGAFAHSKTFAEDSVTAIRKVRDEW